MNTIVLTNPMRLASLGAASWDTALSDPVQKKNAPAAASDIPNRSNNHSARSALMMSPPANESTLNRAASLKTMPRDGPSDACGLLSSAGGSGSRE